MPTTVRPHDATSLQMIDLTDLTDEELREALLTTMLRMLRVPSGPRE
jgi:hypothetical protein